MRWKEITESPLVKPKVRQFKHKISSDLDRRFSSDQSAARQTLDPANGSFNYGSEIDDHEYRLETYEFVHPEDDAKFQYIKAVRGLNGTNPYAPWVYSISVFTDQDTGWIKPVYRMQKLISHDDVPTFYLMTAAARLGDAIGLPATESELTDDGDLSSFNVAINNELELFDQEHTYHGDFPMDELLQLSHYVIRNCISLVCDGYVTPSDPQLAQIGKIVGYLVKRFGYRTDISSSRYNFLFRRMPWGFQPVISDPVAPNRNPHPRPAKASRTPTVVRTDL